MSCPGAGHCPGCGEAGGGVGVLAVAAVAAWVLRPMVAWVAEYFALIEATIGGCAVLMGVVLVRAIRRELGSGPTWCPRDAQVPARMNGTVPRQAIPAPAAPMLTADQVAGLAALGQAVIDTQARTRQHAVTEGRQRHA